MVEAESVINVEASHLQIVLILTTGFALACVLGYLAQLLKLSSLIGYLLAGYMIGPFFPGFTADLTIAEQLAEIGVILMMFGVGMHFKWQDLAKVKNIATIGAIGQTAIATLVSAFLIHMIGWTWQAGIIIGLSIGVASTVVLVRVLTDQKLLETQEGHIAVGWLIAEDILTVISLVLLPTLVLVLSGQEVSISDISVTMFFILVKFVLLIVFMFTLGKRVVSYVLYIIARTRSAELFTLTILALTFFIATGSALLFGTSIALGAFIAGMVIGQTHVRHQAALSASPMKDAFLVIFFLSVGMLFNPSAIFENFNLFISVLSVILIIKPLSAFVITLLFGHSFRTAFILALALAQIGEFSFILAAAATKFKILPDEGYDIIVACALVSIALNPLLFKIMNYFDFYKEKKRHQSKNKDDKTASKDKTNAVIIGGGIIGTSLIPILEKIGIHPVIMDRDVDKIINLIQEKQEAIYGSSTIPKMLEIARIKWAQFLIITNLEIDEMIMTINSARRLQPHILIFVHLKSIEEKRDLEKLRVEFICCDEEQTIHSLNRELTKYWKVNQIRDANIH